MRLLGLTNFYPPLGYGYGAICANVMEGLAERGHEVSVACAEGGPTDALELTTGLAHVPGAWRRPLTGVRGERQSQRLVEGLLADGVDAAVAWHMRGIGKGTLSVLHERGIPVLYMLGDLWAVYEHPGPPSWWPAWTALGRRRGYRALRRAAGSAALPLGIDLREPPIAEEGVCAFASSWLQARYGEEGWWPRTAMVVPNGLPPEATTPARPDSRPGGPPRLAFAGRADESKGADIAVRALAQVPDATLTIAGGAPEAQMSALRDLAASEGVAERVELLGAVPRAEVAALLARSDVLLMPGRIDEAFGLVYLEAMAAGAAVVGTARGGAAEFCHDGENCLVTAPDPSAIARATRRVLDDPQLRDRLVAAGHRTAGHYTLARTVDRVEALLEEQLASRP